MKRRSRCQYRESPGICSEMRIKMKTVLYFGIMGYLSGSILYARIFGALFHRNEIITESRDHNPGTANAFQYGGIWCGLLTLCGDMMKGFLPVWLYLHFAKASPAGLSIVLAAPVIGHIFPVFYQFRGGKGIATTFGCLLGLFPFLQPVLIFACAFLVFSLILRITPNFYRTIAAYSLTLMLLLIKKAGSAVCGGFLIIAAAVFLRLHHSKEVRERMRAKLL